jgi:hypothetical protein
MAWFEPREEYGECVNMTNCKHVLSFREKLDDNTDFYVTIGYSDFWDCYYVHDESGWQLIELVFETLGDAQDFTIELYNLSKKYNNLYEIKKMKGTI